MLKVESCCVDSSRFHTVSFIYFWFCGQGFKFWIYWIVGSVRLAVCKDMARVRLCWRWKVSVWTHPDFTQCRLYICGSVSANISAGLNSKRTLSSHSSWGMVFLDILQDGDFRVFVRDMQANVACTEVVLMQAWRLIAMLLKICLCRHVTVFRHVMDVSFFFPNA